MENSLPTRKTTRLKDFDYAQNGAYFITICTKDKKMLFSPVGAQGVSTLSFHRCFQ
jgi:hypothetical protein